MLSDSSLTSQSPRANLAAFFDGPQARALKERICDIGRRMWLRAYIDGNGGNLAIKVGADLVLCTPTLVSKGFMKPEDLCLVDLAGNQLAGTARRTSEILMHLAIMQRQPRAVATVHGHPPYSNAFGLTGVTPPIGLLSEFEMSVSVGIAPYRTPGTPELSQVVADLADRHNAILMANHGTVTWSHLGLEDAYFKMETLEAYCRTLVAAMELGQPLNQLAPAQVEELLKFKQSMGIPDPRHGFCPWISI